MVGHQQNKNRLTHNLLHLALVIFFLLLLFLVFSAISVSRSSGQDAGAAVVFVVKIDVVSAQETRTLFTHAHVARTRILIPNVRYSQLGVGKVTRFGWNPMAEKMFR